MSGLSESSAAVRVMRWAGLPSVAEDLLDGVTVDQAAARLRQVGEDGYASFLLTAAAHTEPLIIGRPAVHVVTSPDEPVAVFVDVDVAERYAAADEARVLEHAVVCDHVIAEALINEVRL